MFLHALTNQLIPDTNSLLVSHLPVLVFTGIESSVRVAYEQPFFGSSSISFESHPPYWSLTDALMNTFMISRYAICVLEGYMIAIIKHPFSAKGDNLQCPNIRNLMFANN